jgi:hypothetical protein
MNEYYHPATGKTISIETPRLSGGVITVTETNNESVQTLTLKESEINNFVNKLTSSGWLLRQLL